MESCSSQQVRENGLLRGSGMNGRTLCKHCDKLRDIDLLYYMEWLMAGMVRSFALFDMLEMRECSLVLNLQSNSSAAAHTIIICLSATMKV